METLLTIIGVLCIIASSVLGIILSLSSFSLDKEEFLLELMLKLLKWGMGFILTGILICLF